MTSMLLFNFISPDRILLEIDGRFQSGKYFWLFPISKMSIQAYILFIALLLTWLSISIVVYFEESAVKHSFTSLYSEVPQICPPILEDFELFSGEFRPSQRISNFFRGGHICGTSLYIVEILTKELRVTSCKRRAAASDKVTMFRMKLLYFLFPVRNCQGASIDGASRMISKN